MSDLASQDQSQLPSYGPQLVDYFERHAEEPLPAEDLTEKFEFPLEAYSNWVDPDVLAYNEKYGLTIDDHGAELEFKKFFESGWQDPKYDCLRDRWDKLIDDQDPQGRLLGKTALWSLVQLMNLQQTETSNE